MALVGVGKPMPSQFYLMQLAGLVVDGRERVYAPTDAQIVESQREGYERLMRMTGEDFEADVLKWFEFLKESSEETGITHSHGYASMCAILAELGVEIS
jgi:hypothetical protein